MRSDESPGCDLIISKDYFIIQMSKCWGRRWSIFIHMHVNTRFFFCNGCSARIWTNLLFILPYGDVLKIIEQCQRSISFHCGRERKRLRWPLWPMGLLLYLKSSCGSIHIPFSSRFETPIATIRSPPQTIYRLYNNTHYDRERCQ